MTVLFCVDDCSDDLVKAIRMLDQLAGGGKIRLRKSVTIETDDDGLSTILNQMVQVQPIAAVPSGVAIDWQPAEQPPVQEKAKKTQRNPTFPDRKCEICGDLFTPIRGNQVICRKEACRISRSRQYNARHDLKIAAKKLEAEAGQAEGPFDPKSPMLPDSLGRIGTM
jgi:hypothetical protein